MPPLRATLLAAVLVPAALAASPARAEAIAPTAPPSACLATEVEVAAASRSGEWLYRIVFRNRCGVHRSLYWCADNPGAPVPEQLACPRAPRAASLPAEPRHYVLHRKEFQWHLPPGTRIRYRDCPAQELPTFSMDCVPPPAPPQAGARR